MSQGSSASCYIFTDIFSPHLPIAYILNFNFGIGTAKHLVFNTVLANKRGQRDFTNPRQESGHKTSES